MKKIVFWFVLIFLILLSVFFIGGYFANPNFSSSKTIIIKKSPNIVWNVLNDTKRFSEGRHEVKKFEFLPKTKKGLKSWKEHASFFGAMTYEIKEEIPNKKLSIDMIDSGFGMTGNWTFLLTDTLENTKVELIEKSKNSGILMRSILNTLGRDANMRLLLRHLAKEADKIDG